MTAAVWNLFGFIWTEEMVKRGVLAPELDDINQHLLKQRKEESL